MKYTADDIEIFVLSYNRGQYLLETIDCLLNQSLRGIGITVLDNASTGETAEILGAINDERVRVIVNDKNIGGDQNFLKAKSLASKAWTIIFHDDDLIHPNYLERILGILNQDEEITLAAALTELTEHPDHGKWKTSVSSSALIYKDTADFASALMKGLPVPFCAFVYKTELLKQQSIGKAYGKIFDRPFAFDCAGTGTVAILNGIYIQSRVHESRDSNDYSSGPFASQWVELVKKYRELMGDSPFTGSGRTFLNRGARTLLITMNPFIYSEIGRKSYVDMAVKAGAISRLGYYAGLPYYYLYRLAKSVFK